MTSATSAARSGCSFASCSSRGRRLWSFASVAWLLSCSAFSFDCPWQPSQPAVSAVIINNKARERASRCAVFMCGGLLVGELSRRGVLPLQDRPGRAAESIENGLAAHPPGDAAHRGRQLRLAIPPGVPAEQTDDEAAEAR